MGYSKTYQGSVGYSGSVSVQYPASEHGGTTTAHYSGTVPVSVDLYVDTDPFDYSVQDCNRTVNQLNGAIVAMNAAQVSSLRKTAQNISEHVIGGFFKTIKTELSQNMALMFAKFNSVSDLMISQSATLEKQQLVMQDDYSRISNRYNQIFTNLDDELEKRVVALDKNVFTIAKKVQGEQLYSDVAKKVAQFLIGVNEEEIVQQQLALATTKSKVASALERLTENVIQESVYARKIKRITFEEACEKNKDYYVPVIYTESDNLTSDSSENAAKESECFFQSELQGSAGGISGSVKNYFFASSQTQVLTADEQKSVDDAFNLIAENYFQGAQDEKSQRVYAMIKHLRGE